VEEGGRKRESMLNDDLVWMLGWRKVERKIGGYQRNGIDIRFDPTPTYERQTMGMSIMYEQSNIG